MKTKMSKIIAAALAITLLISINPIHAQAFSWFPGSGGGNSAVSSVNHIDIAVNLMANVYIDGELRKAEFTINTADAKYVTITADPVETKFEVSGSVSTSTDNAGNKQIRIDGDFPVGTKNDPVSYTVTLSKTISTTDGIEIPVTLSTTTHYWDSANVCPGFQITPGRQSGIDLKLNNGTGSANSNKVQKGNIHIQKTIIGAPVKEDMTFRYRITDRDGKIHKDQIPLTIPAGKDTASTIVTNMELGEYIVSEIDEKGIDGYRHVRTVYTDDGDATINEERSDTIVNITSYFETDPIVEKPEESPDVPPDTPSVESPDVPPADVPVETPDEDPDEVPTEPAPKPDDEIIVPEPDIPDDVPGTPPPQHDEFPLPEVKPDEEPLPEVTPDEDPDEDPEEDPKGDAESPDTLPPASEPNDNEQTQEPEKTPDNEPNEPITPPDEELDSEPEPIPPTTKPDEDTDANPDQTPDTTPTVPTPEPDTDSEAGKKEPDVTPDPDAPSTEPATDPDVTPKPNPDNSTDDNTTTQNPPATTPQTGDTSIAWIAAVLAGIAGAGIIALLVIYLLTKRKKGE